jgi:hypothetical protein
MMFCFVDIVKRGHLLVPIFGFPHKNEKNTKKIYQKNIRKKSKKNNMSEKMMLEC